METITENTFTDMHSHILPGLDDGAGTMEETLDVLRLAQAQGVKRIIVTPHFHPGRYMVTSARILETLENVREQCRRQEIRVTLFPGQECLYYTGLIEKLEKGTVLTMADSRYVLVEFEPDCQYGFLLRGLQELRYAGYWPILAHFERYPCLAMNRNLEELRELGFLLQMNYDTLLQKGSLFRRPPWKQMVKDGVVDFLGSDCHGMHMRPLRADAVQKWMELGVDEDLRIKILSKNIQKIFENEL